MEWQDIKMFKFATLLTIGLLTPALLSLELFRASLFGHLPVVFIIFLCLAIPFLYFSFTLLYFFLLGASIIGNETEGIYAALFVTDLSFGIDLTFCFFWGLTVTNFLVALILIHLAFLSYLLFSHIRISQQG